MIILERYDDIDYARDRTKTLAEHINVPLCWKGTEIPVDLSAANYERLSELLDPVVKAVKSRDLTADGRARKGKGKGKKRAPGRRSNEYYAELRAWVDANEITKKNGTGKPAYASTDPDRYDYPDWLIAEYDEYLETTQASDAA